MAGGSRIVISDEGITISTNGKILYQAGQHKFEGGQKVSSVIPLIPKLGLYNLIYEVRDKDTQELLPFTKYVLTNELGHSHYGETDENGLTKAIYSDKEESYSLHVITDDFVNLDSEGGQGG